MTAADDDLDRAMQDTIRAHNDLYHPGRLCRENTEGRCLDAFGGEPSPWLLGEYTPDTVYRTT